MPGCTAARLQPPLPGQYHSQAGNDEPASRSFMIVWQQWADELSMWMYTLQSIRLVCVQAFTTSSQQSSIVSPLSMVILQHLQTPDQSILHLKSCRSWLTRHRWMYFQAGY